MKCFIKKFVIIINIIFLWITIAGLQYARSAEPEKNILVQQNKVDLNKSSININKIKDGAGLVPKPTLPPTQPSKTLSDTVIGAIIAAIGAIIVALIGLLNRKK